MLIPFDTMETTVVPHMRGGEKEVLSKLYTDPLCRIMRSRLVPGASVGLHTHETSSEVIYILSGTGRILYDGEYEPLSAGSCHYCPKGHTHSLMNDSPEGGEDMVYLAVVAEQ